MADFSKPKTMEISEGWLFMTVLSFKSDANGVLKAA
jgi:hypothetical protein